MTLYGDTASGEAARLRQTLADARAQIAYDARRARVAENRLDAVRYVLDQHSHYGLVEADDIRRALDAP